MQGLGFKFQGFTGQTTAVPPNGGLLEGLHVEHCPKDSRLSVWTCMVEVLPGPQK